MMNKVAILVLCVVVASPLCLAQTVVPSHPKTIDATVPVWSTNDYWTYRIQNLSVNITQPGLSLQLFLSIADFTMTVISESNDSYQVQVNPTSIAGTYSLNMVTDEGPVYATGALKRTTLQGTMMIAKDDLGVKAVDLTLNGRLVNYIHQQPFIPNLPTTIPIHMTMVSDLAFSSPYALLSFPMNETSVWGLPSSQVTLSGTIDSPWFKVINHVNHFIRNWNLYGVVANMTGMTVDETKQFSDVLYDVFPTVDIAHVMKTYLQGNTVNITALPDLFACVDAESVKVPAGTFTAYNISVMGGLGYIYYAPDAGHIIRTWGQFANLSGGMISNLDLELEKTNYQP